MKLLVDIEDEKSISEGLKEAVDELNLIKQGKLKGIPVEDLLNDL